MLTNSRLIELRETAFKCQEATGNGNATQVAKDYADLFELFEDYIDGASTDGITTDQSSSSLDTLFGK